MAVTKSAIIRMNVELEIIILLRMHIFITERKVGIKTAAVLAQTVVGVVAAITIEA